MYCVGRFKRTNAINTNIILIIPKVKENAIYAIIVYKLPLFAETA